MSGARWAALALAGLIAAGPALAHDQPYSFLDLEVGRSGVTGRITAHVADLAHEIGLAAPDSLLDSTLARAQAERLEAILGAGLRLAAGGDSLPLVWTAVSVDHERRGLTFSFRAASHAPAALEIEARLFPYDPQHETYVNVSEDGALRQQELLDASRPATTFYSGTRQGVLAVVARFVAAGIHHIFIGPDHILFVVALLLPGGSLPRLLRIVTAFTLAHSVTLGLATLGLIDPPAHIVEPIIALSIVVVGVDALRSRPGGGDRRGLLAFGFGFVHGFGFAGVLRDFGLSASALGWSLASFNVGVELGQACIVAAVAPVAALVRGRGPAAEDALVRGGAWVVIAAGGWWLVERVFLAR